MPLTCFKSYDIRGQLGVNLDEDIAYRIGRGFAAAMEPGLVVTGRDGRESSPALQAALIEGLRDGGVDVIDIGFCGTEEVYFGTDHYAAGGGIMVTASHNPIDYNGFKLVKEGARPISKEAGLGEIHDLVEANDFAPVAARGTLEEKFSKAAYVERVLSFVDPAALKPMKVVVNAGNGIAGPTFDAIADALAARGGAVDFVRLFHAPDSSFPNGIPNPLLPENQPPTAEAVRESGADLGIAWDGDFDRCFLFDETGAFVDGEYIVGLLASAYLAKEKGGHIVHDTRVMWNTVDLVEAAGGIAAPSRTGHPLVKQKMRDCDAVYGGEMSAHHYFREFMYCDSGMIPWLLVLEYLSKSGQTLSQTIAKMRDSYPSSGEINFRLSDPEAALAAFERKYADGAISEDRLDGISFAYADWRANVRKSNTEPLLRLNVETRGDRDLLAKMVAEISELLNK